MDEDAEHEEERSQDHFLSDHDLRTLDPFRLVEQSHILPHNKFELLILGEKGMFVTWGSHLHH